MAKPTYTLEVSCWVPRPRPEVFQYFSDAYNLETITPPWLRFQVERMTPAGAVGSGTQIDYRLRLHGLPVRWRSLISVWEPPGRFVDEQVRGPYRSWVHEHLFLEQDDGTCVQDKVQYRVWGGWLVDRFLVRRDVLRIFAYRQEKLRTLFSQPG